MTCHKTVGMAAAMLVATTGCYQSSGGGQPFDVGQSKETGPDADLTPDIVDRRGVERLDPLGFAPPSGACGTAESDGGVQLHFALTGEVPRANYRPGAGGGRDLADDDIQFDVSSARLFEHPDVRCTEGSEDNSVSCQLDGYSCTRSSPDSDEDVQRRCAKETGVSTVSTDFAADTSSNDLFGVLVENTGSLVGRRPGEIGSGGLYYDADGNGRAEADETLYTSLSGDTRTNPVPPTAETSASDAKQERLVALDGLTALWGEAVETAGSSSRSRFGLWRIDGSPEPPSVVAETESEGSVWTNRSGADRAVDRLIESSDPPPERANVLEATRRLIDSSYASGEYDGWDKTLVLLVDGPPERHPSETDVTLDDVLERARSVGVGIFVVQLDSRLRSEALLDDFGYYLPQQEACESDTDCRRWETCREVKGWANQPGPVSDQYSVDGRRCMPARREADGRTGPISAYSRLACETEGAFKYVKAPGALRRSLEPLPFAMDGLWEASISLDGLTDGNVSPQAPIQLELQTGVQTPSADLVHVFSQSGADEKESSVSDDNRGVVFTGPSE